MRFLVGGSRKGRTNDHSHKPIMGYTAKLGLVGHHNEVVIP